jgi:two-component system KDP operon response regulator KdpE
MSKHSVLIIDDEPQIRKLLEITLKNSDFDVRLATNGHEGLIQSANHPPDFIILDLGLPDISGHEVLKQLREWYNQPIIILSVLNNEEDIVNALDNGASDYLTKPFRTGELLARIRLCLRKNFHEPNAEIKIIGDLEIDFVARTFKKNKHLVKLTTTEYQLISLLAKNEGKVLTHQYILKNIWGNSYQDQSQYLRVYVAQLRKKIEDDPVHPNYIITESGVGYRFTDAKKSL